MTDKLTNKPVSPSREMLELLKEWAAPDVTDVKKKEYSGRTNFMGVPIEDLYSKVEVAEEPEEEEVKPLTAEEIEQIRQDAYNEGFTQGQQEGHDKGFEQGTETGHAEGLERGHQEGYQAGLEQGQTEINEKVGRWQRLTEQLYNPVERVDQAAEQQLLNLAVMLAESVIRTEVKTNQEALLSVLHEAVSALPFNTEFAEIHMHPEDMALLSQVFDEQAVAEQKWILKEEPSYQIGDVIVMTPDSLIDRSVKQRIKQTLDAFVDKAELNTELNQKPLTQETVTTPDVQPSMQQPLDTTDTEQQQAESQTAETQPQVDEDN